MSLSRINSGRLLVAILGAGVFAFASWAAWHLIHSRQKSPMIGGESPNETANGLVELDSADRFDERFSAKVQPFLEHYCFSCHDSTKHKGGLDLSRAASVASSARNLRP